MSEDEKMLTVSEVAKDLGRHPATIRRWIEGGVLKGYQLAEHKPWLIPQSELDNVKRKMGIKR